MIDWNPAREAFVSRSIRPTYTELSEEFSISVPQISGCAADQGWVMLRARRIEAELERSDAQDLLLRAARGQKAVVESIANLSLAAVQKLTKLVEELDEDLADATQANTLNTVAFAVANLSKGLKDAGVVGMPKAIMDQLEGKMPAGADGKDFLARTLQQVNITVMAARDGKPIPDVVVDPIREPYPVGGIAHADTESIDRSNTTEAIRQTQAESKALARMIRKEEARALAELADVL